MVSQTSFALKVVVCLLCGSVLHASSLREKNQMSRKLQQTMVLSATPSDQPTMTPSGTPSDQPTMTPSGTPSEQPTMTPSGTPSVHPSEAPSESVHPSTSPNRKPTNRPTAPLIAVTPTKTPSFDSTTEPSGTPSTAPFGAPSTDPSGAPIARPLCKVLGFEIKGWKKNERIRWPLDDGDDFCVKELPKRFNIKVRTDRCVNQVQIQLFNDKNAMIRNKTDSAFPYVIAGKKRPMLYTLIATPDNIVSLAKSITFTILRNCTNTEQDPL